MANKPPDIRLAGIRASVPPGYLLGRVSAGIGGVELISMGKAQSAGLIPSTLPGPPTGAAGGDLSGTYPNPTVAQLQGVAVQAGTPTNLAVLLYHTAGATWLPVVLGAVAYSNAYADLSGKPTIPAGANPTATGSDTAVNGVATTFMRSDAAPAIQKGSSSVFGLVKVDGTTITATGGVISSVGGSGGGAPASIKDDGTNLYLAMQDTAGQLVLDSSGNPIFDLEVLPAASIPIDTAVLGVVTSLISTKICGFSTTMNTAQGVTNNTLTNVIYDTVVFDTLSGYSVITGIFTPTKAGKWLFFYGMRGSVVTTMSLTQAKLLKNGSAIQIVNAGQLAPFPTLSGSIFAFALTSMNGTTDNVQMQTIVQGTGGGDQLDGGNTLNLFGGIFLGA